MIAVDKKRIASLLRDVGTNLKAAHELQLIAANYLKSREPLPDDLADYLANAFMYANSQGSDEYGRRTDGDRIVRLAFALGLTRNEGRPRIPISKFDVALSVVLFGDTLSETLLKRELAKAYGVSESTARNRIKEAKLKIAEGRDCLAAILAANDLKGLVRPRGGDSVLCSAEKMTNF